MDKPKLIRASLLLLLLFVSVTTTVAGIDFMIYSNGMLFSLQPAVLEHTPFSNFFLPGLISLLVVGGSSLVALVLMKDHNLYALPASLVSGVIICMWVSLVSFVFKTILWIEVLYWFIGITVVVFTLYLQKEYDEIKAKKLP